IQLQGRSTAAASSTQAAAKPRLPKASRASANRRVRVGTGPVIWAIVEGCGRIPVPRRYNGGLARRHAASIFLPMYSRSSEPVRFERDCAAVLVPQGEEVSLPAGS